MVRGDWKDVDTRADVGHWRPLLERPVADGMLTDFGIHETVVRQAEDVSHGLWWPSTSIAGIEKPRLEAIRIPPASGLAAAKHRDCFLRSLIWKSRPGSGSGGYLRVATSVIQPGKGAQWRALWEKYSQPFYDEQGSGGTFSAYGVQLEHVVTDDPGVRMVVSILPNAKALLQAQNASNALNAKRSQDKREAITAAFNQVTVPGAARTYLARLTSYSTQQPDQPLGRSAAGRFAGNAPPASSSTAAQHEAVVPLHVPLQAVAEIARFVQAVELPRVDHELRRNACRAQRLVHLLRVE